MRPLTPLIALLFVALPVTTLANAPGSAFAPPSAKAAFEKLQKRHPDARVVWRDGLAGAEMLTSIDETPEGATDLARAQRFLTAWNPLLGIPTSQLRHRKTENSRLRRVVRYQQRYDGLDVLDRYVNVTLDTRGTVLTLSSDAVRITSCKRGKLSRRAATRQAIRGALGLSRKAKLPKIATRARQVIFAAPGRARHVWAVTVVKTPMHEHLEVLVDAITGQVLRISNQVRHG